MACVAGEKALQAARAAHGQQDLAAAVQHATVALEHFSAAEADESKQAASTFLEQLDQARNQARAQVCAASGTTLLSIFVCCSSFLGALCVSREILSVNLWLALLLEQRACTRRGRTLLHGVSIACQRSSTSPTSLRLLHLLRLQELLAAGEAALSRDDMAAARAAGDEARQAAEDCASIPLVRQVEALLLRVEAREVSLWNREQGVHTCGCSRAF